MPDHNEYEPISEDRINTVIYSNQASEMIRFGFRNRTYDENGCIVTEKTAENIESPDGTLISPIDMMRPTKETRLRVCDICRTHSRRNSRRHGRPQIPLSYAATMKRCYSCHKSLCSRHYFTSMADGHARCRRCHWLHRIITSLFFKRTGNR